MSSVKSKSNRTELVFITDKSGSMYGMEADTVGGINAVLDANRKIEGEVVVSLVQFNEKSHVVTDRIPIQEVPTLKECDYQPSGCTALLDALGNGIKHIAKVQKYMPQEYKADKVIFVVTTDGLENSSHKYSYNSVKNLIQNKSEEGWEFLFLAANIDAAAEAEKLGIAEDRAVDCIMDPEGNAAMYASVAEATCTMRTAKPSAPRMGGSWKGSIMRDRQSRGK